ncbi:MAG TPA: DDE-type integrase/transposase/recombinase [Nonomuraea sp.]|nr:DDE-type integrase/transposase/recombinase [Nonomuraea sp.]
MDITPKDHLEAVALFRSEVVGALTRRDLARGELHKELLTLSQQRLRPPKSKLARCFALSTLERWYYAYKAGGLDALKPHPRSDRGRGRQLTDEQRELICDIRREHPSASASVILRTLVDDGRLANDAVSAATLRRLFHDQGLDKVSMQDGQGRRTRLRWQAATVGGLWQGDVCHGPAIEIAGTGTKKPLRVHALIDDASRYVMAIEAHHTETEVDMLGLFCRTLRRHGYPDVLYLDNGSTYRGDALRLCCERLAITLLHPRPGDAPARGKMERFWRTLREGCLDFLPKLVTLDEANARLRTFVDGYHRRAHSSLMGRSPDVVFAEGDAGRRAERITEDMLRDALTVREKRRVRKDTTVSVDGVDWEADQGFLAGRVVTVARSFAEPGAPPWVEHEGQKWPLHRVDAVANSRRSRPSRRPDQPSEPAAPKPPRPFAPAAPVTSATTSTKTTEESTP